MKYVWSSEWWFVLSGDQVVPRIMKGSPDGTIFYRQLDDKVSDDESMSLELFKIYWYTRHVPTDSWTFLCLFGSTARGNWRKSIQTLAAYNNFRADWFWHYLPLEYRQERLHLAKLCMYEVYNNNGWCCLQQTTPCPMVLYCGHIRRPQSRSSSLPSSDLWDLWFEREGHYSIPLETEILLQP